MCSDTVASDPAPAVVAQGPLRGCFLRTPYGWGICTRDVPNEPHVQVALDWRIAGRQRVPCTVRRSDVTDRSFCSAGQCVLTTYGTGVLLRFRPSDGVHMVQLWGPLGRGRNVASLQRKALLAVIPAAVGLSVETPHGRGVCRGYRAPDVGAGGEPGDAERDVVVELEEGTKVLKASEVQCPVAMAMPLTHRFSERASDLFKVHSGTLFKLREALQGLGLEQLQQKLASSAGEAADAASQLWEEWESKDMTTVADTLKLKADEVLSDPKMKSVMNAGIARLNKLVCKAEGFDGVWVGKGDGQPRCIIDDATIKWHWGEDSQLEIWADDKVSTILSDDVFRGKLLPGPALEWSDGDTWVRSGPLPGKADDKAGAGAAAGQEDGAGADGSVADLAVVQRSLADLRRIVGGQGLEGDMETALGALTKVASADSEVQKIIEELQSRRELILELRGQVMQSKAGQVVLQGTERLTEQLSKLGESAITPSLERVQERGKRLVTRLATDKQMKSKAAQLFSVAQARLTEKWNDQNDPHRGGIEAWLTSVKERVIGQLSVHRAMLVESLGGIDLQQVDLSKLIANSWDPVALERHLEEMLVQGISLSGAGWTGAELLDRFESADSVSNIPVFQRTYQGILSILGDLDIEVPLPMRKLLEAQAAGASNDVNTWKEAIVSSLDDETVVKGATELVKQGETMISQLQEMKGIDTVAKVMEHLENEDIERELLKTFHSIDPEALLSRAESALTNAEAREALISHLKDTCLDFILRILPAIQIEKLAGNDNGCDWEINNISFSDFGFRKENVLLKLGDIASGDHELLQVSAWDISAHFRKLKVTVKQTIFPFMEAEGMAEAKAERMSVAFAFKLQPGKDGEQPTLAMSSRKVLMDTLELNVSETSYAVVVNALSFLFADVLKDYACQKIAKHLDENMGALVDGLNAAMSAASPVLAKLGVAWPEPGQGSGSGPKVEDVTDAEAEAAESPTSRLRGGAFPEEIDWADPGRSFAVRV